MAQQAIVGWYLFFLGLAAGATVLAMTAYWAVSPRWLRWWLLASGLFVISRYVTMTLFATSPDPQPVWGPRRCWFATTLGLTFPSAVALDQLVRHPAMSPTKLMRWLSPFFVGYAIVLLFGQMELAPNAIVGMQPHLVGWGRGLLAGTEGFFVIGFLWVGAQVLNKLSSRRIRVALLGLMIAQGYLGLDGLLVALGLGHHPFLCSEIFALMAIWCALETARQGSL